MGEKELKEHIRKKAEDEIAEIRKQASEEVRKINDGIRAEITKSVAEIEKASERNAFAVEKRITAEASLKASAMIESKKAGLIDKAFEKARMRIAEMPDAKKSAMLKKLATEGSKSIKDAVVYVDHRYTSLLPGAKPRGIGDFGVIIESSDGSASVDNTLGALISSMKADMIPEISRILFSTKKHR